MFQIIFFLPHSCFASKKREDIAQMVRDEVKGTFNTYLYSIKYPIYYCEAILPSYILEQVERISEADLTLQIQYMAQKPRKINIYQDKGFLLELDAVQKGKDGRGLSTSSGRQTNKPYPSEKSPNKDGVQQQSSIDEDKSKERFVFQTKLINSDS